MPIARDFIQSIFPGVFSCCSSCPSVLCYDRLTGEGFSHCIQGGAAGISGDLKVVVKS